MRKATTLIELIFVVVIIGILSGVAYYNFKPNHLRDDVNYVVLKLNEVRYQGINYDKRLSSLGSVDNSIGCIDISTLNENNNTSTKSNDYKFYSNISFSPNGTTLCFDIYSKPTLDGTNTDINITLSYSGKNKTININKTTGYIRILD